ncbi:uncharacterized protein J3D65DRAFT_425815 [Phyllosticta citribraziliensis]|uniref:Uncharacterized protein n=1 Tax=Phyllosticta citribraziliensis TaxID=989973 RepID=A0ABR1LI07_9PEZI
MDGTVGINHSYVWRNSRRVCRANDTTLCDVRCAVRVPFLSFLSLSLSLSLASSFTHAPLRHTHIRPYIIIRTYESYPSHPTATPCRALPCSYKTPPRVLRMPYVLCIDTDGCEVPTSTTGRYGRQMPPRQPPHDEYLLHARRRRGAADRQTDRQPEGWMHVVSCMESVHLCIEEKDLVSGRAEDGWMGCESDGSRINGSMSVSVKQT